MSVIASFYNVDFSVKKSVTSSSTSTNSYNVTSGYRGVFRPIADRTQLFGINNQGKEYELFCEPTVDVDENDLVTINNVDYGVAGVSLFQDLEDSSESHLEVRIFEK